MKKNVKSVLKIVTTNKNNYEVNRYINSDGTFLDIVKSNSSSLKGIDFVVPNDITIGERLQYKGTLYYNCRIKFDDSNNIQFVPRKKKKDYTKMEMSDMIRTSIIKNIDIIDKEIYNDMIERKSIIVEEEVA